jgi:hypothetical protein
MENNQIDETSKTAKKKLTRDELLAGKCSPEDAPSPGDPRFKSPDEILLQMVSQRRGSPPAEVTIQHGYRRGETTLGPDATVDRTPDTETLKKNFQQLTERYDKDIARWRDYEQRILHWKAEVMNVIQNLQDDANEADSLKKEIETLKELNRQKDDEIRSLADEIKKIGGKKK